MSCLLALLAIITPRIAIVMIWLFSDWLGRAYDSAIWPVLGFIFAPYTTLAYMYAMLRTGGELTGMWIGLVVIAVIADLSSSGNASRKRARQRGPC